MQDNNYTPIYFCEVREAAVRCLGRLGDDGCCVGVEQGGGESVSLSWLPGISSTVGQVNRSLALSMGLIPFVKTKESEVIKVYRGKPDYTRIQTFQDALSCLWSQLQNIISYSSVSLVETTRTKQPMARRLQN